MIDVDLNTISEEEIRSLFERLMPLNRSLSGVGNRMTLKILKEIISDLKIKKFKSGQQVYDWKVPEEWNVKEAYIQTPNGKIICDFKINNLHLIGYSQPQNVYLTLNELKKFLHTKPEQPNAIPYITSYYSKRWGFCMSHNDYLQLKDNGLYHVVIDSNFRKTGLDYGEVIIKGSKKEMLLSTYICHPSMANNELSGPILTALLARWIKTLGN